MSLTRMLEYTKPEKIKNNNVLLEIARKVINMSPEPRYKIKLRDEVLSMKEKERLGFNFNRSVTASLRSRWDVVEKATMDYLQEVLEMNDQIEDDGRKYENQLINLIVTRTTNLGLNSRIEQMAGLFMHMNFYCTVLKFKIQHLEPTRAFMFNCSDLMGFSRPSQLIDRYAALQHVFTELYADYETRQNLLNHLTETLGEVKAETNHRNMLMHNQMAAMHARIKNIQTESAQLERAIQDQMELSTGASLEIYKIKNAVYNIYITLMTYRGMDASQTDSYAQLDELEVRINHTQAAVKMLQIEEAKRQSKKKVRRKTNAYETARGDDDVYSDSYKSDDDSDNEGLSLNENANVSAVQSSLMSGGVSGFQRAKNIPKISGNKRDQIHSASSETLQTKTKRIRLPAINKNAAIVLDKQLDVDTADTKMSSFPLIDANVNRAAGSKLRSQSITNRGCVSLMANRSTLPGIRALKRSSTALMSEISYLKEACEAWETNKQVTEKLVSDANLPAEGCSVVNESGIKENIIKEPELSKKTPKKRAAVGIRQI